MLQSGKGTSASYLFKVKHTTVLGAYFLPVGMQQAEEAKSADIQGI